jgi:alkanesulfonate monooxygenase SsuD/methylene tetrahydromethanopterin reductase-like flavin-dependent oxidoreductase (luciferase family)
MTKAAATYADGVHGHLLTSLAYLDNNVLPRIEAALAEADRDRDAFTLSTGVIVSISDDRDVEVRETKQQVGFYGTTPNYKPVFDASGGGDLTAEMRAAWDARDLETLVGAVPDRAVERYAIAGTPDEVVERLPAFRERVDHLVLQPAWHGVPPPRIAENLGAILETFGSDTKAA